MGAYAPRISMGATWGATLHMRRHFRSIDIWIIRYPLLDKVQS
jgi:hypothetical protein